MLAPLSVDTWKVLRKVLRDGSSYGKSLRVTPTRRTKDGQFLSFLVACGLLAVKGNGHPFDKMYELTELGRNAAEYGEFEIDFVLLKKAEMKNGRSYAGTGV